MVSMSKSLKDFSYLVSSNAFLKIMGIVSVMVFTRYLEKEEIALIPLFVMVETFSTQVFSFGVLHTLVREVPHLLNKNKVRDVHSYIANCLVIIVPGILLFSFLFYAFSDAIAYFFFAEYTFVPHLELMAVGVFFAGINKAFSYVYWCLSRFQQESKRMVLVGILRIATGITFVILWGAYGLIASYVLTSFINTIVYVYNLKDVLVIKSFSFYRLKNLIKESVPFYLEGYVVFFRAEGDQFFVASMLGPEAMAIYYIAKKPQEVLVSFFYSLDRVLTTSLAKLKAHKEQFNNKINSIITLNNYLLFPLIFIAIGITPFLIEIVAGKGYEAAVVPSIVLLLWLLIQVSWKTVLGKSVFILKPGVVRLKVNFVETVSLLVMMVLLGNFFGLLGMVAGRVFAALVGGICCYYFVKNDISIHIDTKNTALLLLFNTCMSLLLLGTQYFSSSNILFGLSFLLSLLLFLFLVNRTISGRFYEVVNSVSPIKIIDPFVLLYSKVKNIKALYLNNF